ncbi:MAG: hypothetical protein GC164_06565 [Phycisphaera sp.]|nr:hypothetical protein [Phycisphaera sp.]
MKPRLRVTWACAVVWVLSVAHTQAALVTSDLATFTGGGGGSANTSIYTLTSTSDSSFTLQNSVTDGSFLDGADDGYAMLRRTATTSKNNIVHGNYGTVEAGDVGKTVKIDAGFRHETGTEVNWSIQLNGVNVGTEGGQSYLSANTFTSGDLDPDTNYKLTTVTAGAEGNIGRTTGPLTYTLQVGDVGKALGLQITSFDSSNPGGAGSRLIYIDSIRYVVPEPASVAVALAGLVLLTRRRRV